MNNEEIIKSYKLYFHNKSKNNWRIITKKKENILDNFLQLNRKLTNFVYKERYIKTKKFNNKELLSKYRKEYENYFQSFFNLKSAYSQNIYRTANNRYNFTSKSFYSYAKKEWKSNKFKMKKPYSNDILEFELDNRMLKSNNKAFIKDNEINNLYWLSISNFQKKIKKNNKEYSKFINIPLLIYPEIQQYIDQWFKYSFALGDWYVKITFKINLEQLNKESKKLNSNFKKLDKLAIDFWKYLTIAKSDWTTEQYNLSKMYDKILKIKKEISRYQSKLAILKNNKYFWNEYKELKERIRFLNKKASNILKNKYRFISNRILEQQPKKVVVEDLTFLTIKKKNKDWSRNKDYKWRKFNKIINIMSRWRFLRILESKISMVGNHLEKIDARYSSQCCYNCLYIDKRNRHWRKFKCLSCWYTNDADINAWMNILHSKHIIARQKMSAI